jgi:hypothetical protein
VSRSIHRRVSDWFDDIKLADWIEPATGSVLRTETFKHCGGERTLTTPEQEVDLALRI